MINYNLKINFQDEKVLSSDIVFVSGDIGAYKLIFDFYDNGQKVDISKYTLSVKAKRPDGVKIASAGQIENGKAIFIPESNIYALPGDLYLEIALCDASGKYLTAKIIIASVIEGLGETDVEGAETSSVYVTLLSNIQSKIDQANQLIRDSVPVKGVDYYTEEDKEELEQRFIEALPEFVGEKVFEDLGGVVFERGEIFNDYENNQARGDFSHAEGSKTATYDSYGHAEGYDTEARGIAAHTEGIGTKSSGGAQHVQGKYNETDIDGKYAHIVGGGAEQAPKNIHTLDWNGTAWFAGEIRVGGVNQDDGELVATTKDIDEIVNEMSSVLDELHNYAQSLISGGAE